MISSPAVNKSLRLLLSVTFSFILIGCADRADAPPETVPSAPTLPTAVVDVTARGLELIMTDEVPSGWITFRFSNETDMTHFAVIERAPTGIGVAEQQADVAPVFQKGMDLLNAGNPDAAFAAFGELPEWFGEIVFMGGPGLTSAHVVSETTVYLEPGGYLIECYVKTGGIFHSYNPDPDTYGMIAEFTVTDDVSPGTEPEASISLTISSESGILVEGDPTAGEHVVAVHYQDQIVHENFLGHDVHLARLEDDTDLAVLATWMDWSQPTGLETPAPVTFVGGVQEMPAGSTAYFNANLEPGRYAWIAETTNPDQKNMMIPFEVAH
jgi:hypothetical protein